ncbi:MAG: 3-methyl-2-oxobutanoate hydroxymethyltransferase [Verrucomicrobia bacterium]|nr:3-methyl-2-oxobutanoate hydroxymethyltransferase [Verrucomicrobiota bacterium]
MNTVNQTKIFQLQEKKRGKQGICALTAYDFPQAQMVDQAGVDVILVGDSLGNVVLGRPDTLEVTMSEMLHHVRAVARARCQALLVADLPNHSYDTVESALVNARLLMDAGAEAVKLEGGSVVCAQIQAIVAEGIPVMGHAGLLPQTAHLDGGFRIRGKTDIEVQTIRKDVMAIESAGAFAVVLELVEKNISGELTHSLTIPTIGIGSGSRCDGQILVLHDLLGLGPGPFPKHAHPPVHYFEKMLGTLKAWKSQVEQGQ